MVQNNDEKHFGAVEHVLESRIAVKNTLPTMKENVDIVNLDPVMRIAPGRNLEQQRKFFSTAKRKRKHNVKYAKATDEEKAIFMSQNIFAEERVEKDITVRDTEEEAMKLTKGD